MKKWIFVCAGLLSACGSDPHEHVGNVVIDGREVIVRRSQAEENTWSAFHAVLSDRLQFSGGYFHRNLQGIESVSGCDLVPNTAIHTGPTTIAVVDCR